MNDSEQSNPPLFMSVTSPEGIVESPTNVFREHITGLNPPTRVNVLSNVPKNEGNPIQQFPDRSVSSQMKRETQIERMPRSEPRVGSWLVPDEYHGDSQRRHPSRSVSRRRRADAAQPIYIGAVHNNHISGVPTVTPNGIVDPRGCMGLMLPPQPPAPEDADKSPQQFIHRHPVTWAAKIKFNITMLWEGVKRTYWHLEPWVVRPLVAGFLYNFGVQAARLLLQKWFPTYFPTTVYLPLRAGAQFYNLHTHTQVDIDGSPSHPMLETSV